MRRIRVLPVVLIAMVMLASMLVMTLPAMASEIVLKKNTIPDNEAHYLIGDTIHYEVIVQNPATNNATNTIETLIDTLPDGTTVVLATNLVQVPGASNTYYVDYVVHESDMDYNEFAEQKWRVYNSVEAIGVDDLFDPFDAVVTKNSIIDVFPSIDIEKYVNGVDADSPTGPVVTVGSSVEFTFTVRNTGNITLNNVMVTDDTYGTIGGPITLAPNDYSPGGADEFTWTISRTATAGQHTNMATVIGTPTVGSPITDSDPGNYFGLNIGIDIEKLVSVDGGLTWLDADTAPGPNAIVPGNVQFKVRVTNNSNVVLTGITVYDTDFTFTGVSTTLGIGAWDESDVLTVAAVVGQHENLANVIGYYNQASATDEDYAHYFGLPSISIDIEKLVSVDGGETWHDADTAPGPNATVPGNVWFKVVVTNNSNVALTGIAVNDTDFTFTGVSTTLGIGASDESDVLMVAAVVGQHQNLASVIGYYGQLSDTDEDYAHYWGLPRISIDIEKLVSVDGGITWLDADAAPGPNATVPGNVRFKVVVTNNSNVALTGITVYDTDFVFTGVSTTLGIGASDESDVLVVPAVVGQHENLANVIGYYGQLSDTDEDYAHYYGLPNISIDIEKLVSVDGGLTWLDADAAPGPNAAVPGNVRFKVIVTNNSNVALTGIVVQDTDFVFTGVSTTLGIGASDESDVLVVPAVVGQHENLASVIGYYGQLYDTDEDYAHYWGLAQIGIDIEKYVSVDGGITWVDADMAPGPNATVPGNVRFKVVVTNAGNVPLTGIMVNDTDFTFTGVATSLAVGASDESDVLVVPAVVGQHENLATVVGYYNQESVTDQDYAHYWGLPRIEIDIEKYVSVDGGITWIDADTAPGPNATVPGNVQFKVRVTNNSNVALTGIVVEDTDFTFTGVSTSLGIGEWDESDVLTVAAVVGQHQNLADVIGYYGQMFDTDEDYAHYWGVPRIEIDIEKLVSVDGGVTWHDADSAPGPQAMVPGTVKFKVIVTNNSNVALTGIVVHDTDFTFTGVSTTLGIGASDESDVITVAAVAGQHMNMADVVGYFNDQYSDTDSDYAHYFGIAPAIDIEKLVNGLDADTAPGLIICGDRICWVTFTFIVTNTGNIPLTNIQVDDNVFGHLGTIEFLAVGESRTYTREVLSEPGQHMNIATAVAAEGVSDTDLGFYYGTTSDINLEKLVNGLDADDAPGPSVALGSQVRFDFVVTNTGNTTLTYIVVSDSVFGYVGTIPFLEAGQSQTLTVFAPALAGQHTNIGTAVSESCNAIDTDPGNYFGTAPAIDLEKLIMGFDADVAPGWIEWCVGCVITYEFIVTNTGNVPLTNIVVTDNVFGAIGTIQLLAVGASQTFTRTSISEAGQHSNTAIATANEGVSDTDLVFYFGALPGLDLEKLVNGSDADSAPGPVVAIGSTVTFSFVVTNTGNIGLAHVVVYDDVLGDIGIIEWLAVGTSQTLTATAAATIGQHVNLGSAMYCDVLDIDYGYYFGDEYVEPEPEEGMSIGWWRTHRSVWDGYSTGDTAGDIFSFPTSLGNLAAKNLFDILGGKIRMTDENATASNLVKAAIAALLNAAHPEINYPMSEAEIISEVNSALGSLNIGIMEDLTEELNEYNGLGGSID